VADQSCQISGISSQDTLILATEIGDYYSFKGINACPDATANVLSFSETRKYCSNDYNKDKDQFVSTPPGDKTYTFTCKDGLYVHKIPIINRSVNVTSVSQNIQEYSVREQTNAKRAKDLSKYMGYPSPQSLIDMINQGAIVNCPVTAKDVARANNIFGPDLASVRGKTRKGKIKVPPVEFLPREISSDLVLNTDIMFVNSNAFLISVSTPLGLTIVNELGYSKGARSLKTIAPALLQ
jgi:hypothetical protein